MTTLREALQMDGLLDQDNLTLAGAIQRYQDHIEFWKKDSATAWTVCEERRTHNVALENQLKDFQACVHEWQERYDAVMKDRDFVMATDTGLRAQISDEHDTILAYRALMDEAAATIDGAIETHIYDGKVPDDAPEVDLVARLRKAAGPFANAMRNGRPPNRAQDRTLEDLVAMSVAAEDERITRAASGAQEGDQRATTGNADCEMYHHGEWRRVVGYQGSTQPGRVEPIFEASPTAGVLMHQVAALCKTIEGVQNQLTTHGECIEQIEGVVVNDHAQTLGTMSARIDDLAKTVEERVSEIERALGTQAYRRSVAVKLGRMAQLEVVVRELVDHAWPTSFGEVSREFIEAWDVIGKDQP